MNDSDAFECLSNTHTFSFFFLFSVSLMSFQLKTSYKKNYAKKQTALHEEERDAKGRRLVQCVPTIVIKTDKRGWMRHRTTMIAFPGPSHIGGAAKSNRRSFGAVFDANDRDFWGAPIPEQEESEDTLAERKREKEEESKGNIQTVILDNNNSTSMSRDREEALGVVNGVFRARLSTKENRQVMSTEMAKLVFHGKFEEDEFPACTIDVRLMDGPNPQTNEARFPFLAKRRFGRLVDGAPKHSNISVSYCASGSHGIAGSDNYSSSLLCILMVAYHLWRNLTVPINLRSFTAVNLTAKGSVSGCIDLQAFGNEHCDEETYASTIVQTPRYPGTRIALDRPLDQMVCLCQKDKTLFNKLSADQNPRNFIFLNNRASPLADAKSKKSNKKTNGDAKLVIYDTGSFNIAGLKNPVHFLLASHFVHLFVKWIQEDFPLSGEDRASRHAPKRARTSIVISHGIKTAARHRCTQARTQTIIHETNMSQ